MPSLRCPRCANVVSIQQGETPTCPRCGFGVGVDIPTEAPNLEPIRSLPEAQPVLQTTPPRRTPRLAIAMLVGILLVGGGIGAAFLFGDHGAGAKGGATTEAQLKSALASIRDGTIAHDEDGSDRAFGMVGTVTGSPGGSDGSGGEMTIHLRMLFDRPHGAYEMSYKGGGGGVTVDLGIKQKGHLINYVQGDEVFEGRDEDPSTLPELGDVEEMNGGSAEGPLADLFGSGAVDRQEPATFKGKAATKFYVHDPNGTDDHGEIIVYDATTRVAWMKMTSEGMTAEFEMLYGKEVKVNVQKSDRRASFVIGDQPFGSGSSFEGACDLEPGSYQGESRHCTVPAGHVQEVKLDEVELRANRASYNGSSQSGEPVASMKLTEASKTENGVTLRYDDTDGDGLVSAGDAYSYEVAAGEEGSYHQVIFYDLWADAPAGGPGFPMPGFDLGVVLAGLAVSVMVLARRRQG